MPPRGGDVPFGADLTAEEQGRVRKLVEASPLVDREAKTILASDIVTAERFLAELRDRASIKTDELRAVATILRARHRNLEALKLLVPPPPEDPLAKLGEVKPLKPRAAVQTPAAAPASPPGRFAVSAQDLEAEIKS